MNLKVLFQNDQWVAIEKPAGLFVHPSFMGKRDEPSAMKLLRDQLDQWVYPVHRLDRATSGVLLFGLNPMLPMSSPRSFVSDNEEDLLRRCERLGARWSSDDPETIRKIDDDGNL